MTATTSHQQLQVEQRIVEGPLGFEQVQVAIQPDRAWLLQQLLAACDDDRTLWHELRRAHWIEPVDEHGVQKRREIVEKLAARPGLETAWTMTQTLDETEQLRVLIDEEGVEPDRCRTGCGRYATNGTEWCDVCVDEAAHRVVA